MISLAVSEVNEKKMETIISAFLGAIIVGLIAGYSHFCGE
jgi:fructose-specific phosphotransferase system IIC component